MDCRTISRAIPCVLFVTVIGVAPGIVGAETAPTRSDTRYTAIYSDSVEGNPGGAPAIGPGLVLINGASVVTDPSLVIAGKGSIRLANGATLATNPATLALAPRTTYIVELQYRVVKRGSDDNLLNMWFAAANDVQNTHTNVSVPSMLKNAETAGTFSTGALTADAAGYTLRISAVGTSEVIVDDIRILRQDTVASGEIPARFERLRTLPFPRLGNYTNMSSTNIARGLTPENSPFQYTVTEVEKRLALSDVIAGVQLSCQTTDPAFLRRLRILNPDIVILAYRLSTEQSMNVWHPSNATVNVDDQFLSAIADDWYLHNTKGDYLVESDFPAIRFMNISPFCPLVKGDSFLSFLRAWLQQNVLASGAWDGIFFDNLFGRTNPHIPNSSDPSLFDADYNRNNARDETPAAVSDMSRAVALDTAATLRSRNGDLQLLMGNTGAMPEPALAPYLNGVTFEVFNFRWMRNRPSPSAGAWRDAFEAYRWMDANAHEPRTNIIEGSGPQDTATNTPTAADINMNRFVLGTALLGDAFYDYDLHGMGSAPTWWDEFAVNAAGVAVEERAGKGYLGQALTGATELREQGTLIFEELFDRSALPASIGATSSDVAVVSTNPNEVIAGTGSLIVRNAEYGKNQSVSAYIRTNALNLAAGSTYEVVFDWRVIDTLNRPISVGVYANGQTLDSFQLNGAVAGDSGTVHFPLTVTTGDPWALNFGLMSGGKVAIDNLRVYRGGVGPWRRDFESGFVLVNPLSIPHTFSTADLAGSLRRTGIRRIKGTQAPDVNTGQPVADSLTLGPFDAIILLADHMSRPQRRRTVGH